MSAVQEVPDGSIYYWCYIQGLRHVDIAEVAAAVTLAGKQMRGKDVQNYWNGYYNSDLNSGPRKHSILDIRSSDLLVDATRKKFSEYPMNPYAGKPEVPCRWVPCSAEGKPLIRWGSGCLLRSEAECRLGCKGLAENLKGCQHIAIDIDGDHDPDNIDWDVLAFGEVMAEYTEAHMKPPNEHGKVTSMHLLYRTDRVVPTMHFPAAHIDIIGNEKNSIRYLKNKVPNGNAMMQMDDAAWQRIMDYIKSREE